MTTDFCAMLRSQFRAALAMLEQCIDVCPADHWDVRIATYPFWQVVYHTLCFLDCYLTPSNDEFKRLVEARAHEPFNPQPRGMAELEDEYPSRRFTREEMLAYAAFCREKLDTTMEVETDASLAGASGFSWLTFTRAELHLHNLRHVQHHTGQLTASLRRVAVETRWVKMG